jgi:acetyl esterase/lipase
MAPPRLPLSAERWIARTVCGLPPWAQRRLFGAPPRIDGQTLAIETHTLLKLAELSGGENLYAGRSPAQARALALRHALLAAPHPPIPMARVEALEAPGVAGPIPARLYVPQGLQTDPAPPLLVYYHGGGWVFGDLDSHDGTCRFLAAEAGIAVLSVAYRLAPEHPFPAPLEDAWAGFAWAAASAASLGFDPERIAVGGDSAGANMAAVICLLARSGGGAMPAMQLLIYPPTNADGDTRSRKLFSRGFVLTKADMDALDAAYLPPGIDRSDPRFSVLRAPDLRALPPAYVATAGFDPLRDEGEAFALRLREAGVHVALRRHSSLVHTFANQIGISRGARAAMLEVAGALRMGMAPGDAGR